MRKMLVVVGALLLSSCTTLTPEQIAALRVQIQAYTVSVCAFQPNLADVGELITAFYAEATPYVDIVTTVGNAICKAPETRSVRRRGLVFAQTRVVATPKGSVVVHGVYSRGVQ